MSLKIVPFKWLPYLPGVNELTGMEFCRDPSYSLLLFLPQLEVYEDLEDHILAKVQLSEDEKAYLTKLCKVFTCVATQDFCWNSHSHDLISSIEIHVNKKLYM